jgi:WD40 repeat protein
MFDSIPCELSFDLLLFLISHFSLRIYVVLCSLERPLVEVEHAHDAPIWDVEWHPLGHCMATGGGDRTTRFWIRDEPGSEKEDMGSKMFDDEEEEGLKQLRESMRGRRRGAMFHQRRRGRY